MNNININKICALSFVFLLLGCANKMVDKDKPFLKHASIFLVRHAEKDAGDDPRLSAAGRVRAGHLVSALEGKSIHKIFVTQYRRTQETADSLRVNMRVDTFHYMADATGEALLKTLEKHQVKNDNILIVGHSNTIPILLGRLGITVPVTISDNEYNTLYLIKYVKGEPMLFRKKFGDPMMQSENTDWEEVL